MINVELKAGDLFLSKNPSRFLGKIVPRISGIYSLDRNAIYGHAGIIINSTGDTFEARQHVSKLNIFRDYSGTQILIARSELMNDIEFERAFSQVSYLEGQSYPWQRLILHLLRIAQQFHWSGKVVCSELVVKFLNQVYQDHNFHDFQDWFGFSPDNLHDIYRNQRTFNIIFEGIV